MTLHVRHASAVTFIIYYDDESFSLVRACFNQRISEVRRKSITNFSTVTERGFLSVMLSVSPPHSSFVAKKSAQIMLNFFSANLFWEINERSKLPQIKTSAGKQKHLPGKIAD